MTLETWTPERVERLRSCVVTGLTCSQIAAQIGVSRNAVIGKLHRLGLSSGGPPGGAARSAPPPAACPPRAAEPAPAVAPDVFERRARGRQRSKRDQRGQRAALLASRS